MSRTTTSSSIASSPIATDQRLICHKVYKHYNIYSPTGTQRWAIAGKHQAWAWVTRNLEPTMSVGPLAKGVTGQVSTIARFRWLSCFLAVDRSLPHRLIISRAFKAQRLILKAQRAGASTYFKCVLLESWSSTGAVIIRPGGGGGTAAWRSAGMRVAPTARRRRALCRLK